MNTIHQPGLVVPGLIVDLSKKPMYLMIRCPSCRQENYAPAVATGECIWCGLNVYNIRLVERHQAIRLFYELVNELVASDPEIAPSSILGPNRASDKIFRYRKDLVLSMNLASITCKTIAELFRVSKPTVHSWISQGKRQKHEEIALSNGTHG